MVVLKHMGTLYINNRSEGSLSQHIKLKHGGNVSGNSSSRGGVIG